MGPNFVPWKSIRNQAAPVHGAMRSRDRAMDPALRASHIPPAGSFASVVGSLPTRRDRFRAIHPRYARVRAAGPTATVTAEGLSPPGGRDGGKRVGYSTLKKELLLAAIIKMLHGAVTSGEPRPSFADGISGLFMFLVGQRSLRRVGHGSPVSSGTRMNPSVPHRSRRSMILPTPSRRTTAPKPERRG